MDELLVKYMLGEAGAEEINTVDQWLQANEDNRRYFEHFKLIWQTGEQLKTESRLDPDQSWNNFKQIAESRAAQKRSLSPRWMRMAAVWLIICCASAAVYVMLRPGKVEMLAFETGNTVKMDTLPDGSIITLNKNSAIAYPNRFAGNTREITLKHGEGFFSIEHDKTKPFLIHVNDVVVKVVGTSFNIKKGKDTTQVIVETGIVQVIHKKVNVKLKPKEQAEVDARTGEIKKSQSSDVFYNYYRTHQLIADNTPLWRVAEVLSEAYQISIIVPDKKVAALKLNTTLPLNSLDDNLRVIHDTFGLKIIRQKNQIIIIQ